MLNKSLTFIACISVLLVIWSVGCINADKKDNGTEDNNEDDDDNLKIESSIPMKVETMNEEDGGHEPYKCSSHLVDPDVGTQYLVLVKNPGIKEDSFIFESDAPNSWNVTFSGGDELNQIPGEEWGYKIVTITTEITEKDTFQEIKIKVRSTTNSSRTGYITTKNTVDLFSSEEADLDNHPAKVDYNLVYYGGGEIFNEYGWYHNQGGEFEAEDNSVIIGFEEGLKGMREGQSRVVEIPPEKGYGEDDYKHLGGRPMIFEIKMLDTNTED